MSRFLVFKREVDLRRLPHRVVAQDFRAKQWFDYDFKREAIEFIETCCGSGLWSSQTMGGFVSFYFEHETDALMFKMRHG